MTSVLVPGPVHELWQRLATEYSGAVSPGRVLAHVVRTERRLRDLGLGAASLLDLIETSVRSQLAHATARPVPVQRRHPDAAKGPENDVRP